MIDLPFAAASDDSVSSTAAKPDKSKKSICEKSDYTAHWSLPSFNLREVQSRSHMMLEDFLVEAFADRALRGRKVLEIIKSLLNGC